MIPFERTIASFSIRRTALSAVAALALWWAPHDASALDRPVVASNGMIVAGHPLAVQAGLKVLLDGGNACDAAVAVATSLSVTMTDMMGPLGSGYALIWDANKKQVSAIDYNGVAPLATDPKKFDMEKKRRGILAATVPGALKGWEEIHKKCGSKPWADLWQDAIRLAEGRPLDAESALHIRRHIPEIGLYETWAAEFLDNGQAPAPGAIHRRAALAETYRQFAKLGSDALYKGPVGEQLASFMQASGGLISKDDLTKYTVKWVDPIQSSYRGYTILGAPPSSSSITWMQILNILEGFDLKSLKHNSAEYLRVFIEATKHAYLDAYRYNGDPAFVQVPVEKLLSKPYAQELQQKIRDTMRWDVKPVKTGLVHPARTNHATSHMVIIDKWGNAVSSTNTLGTFFGAGVVVKGTGLVLSNGMDWFDIDENVWTGEKPGPLVMAPGKRNRWTLAPGLLFKDSKLAMIVGGAGAESTMFGIAQPIVNVIDFGMDPQTALNAPRFLWGDTYHYTGGTEVFLYPGIADDVRNQLKAWGYNVPEAGKQRNLARGTTNMITIDPKSGAYWGGAAPTARDFVAGY
jgi:gamma-glutamyltranspeptidase/glutathione hydrolase